MHMPLLASSATRIRDMALTVGSSGHNCLKIVLSYGNSSFFPPYKIMTPMQHPSSAPSRMCYQSKNVFLNFKKGK